MLDRTIAYGLDFFYPAHDDTVGANLARHGEFARPEADFLIESAAARQGLFLDVGANIGAIALPFASKRRGWRVVAVEAHGPLSGLLATNAVNNRLFNVEVVQAAGGASRRVVEFPNPPLNGRGNYGVLSLGSEGLETRPVAMIPLDDLAPDGAQIVKVDVEGYEAEVLKGAPRLLHESRPIWLVEARKDDPAVGDVISIFLAAGYSLHWFFAPFVTPRALKGAAPPSVGAGDSNIVALPPGAPNRWELPPVDPAAPRRPEAAEAYPYLGRYGYF